MVHASEGMSPTKHNFQMKLFTSIAAAVVLGASFVASGSAEAKGNCTFTETSGKTIVQSAVVHGSHGQHLD
ncbi:hypothetical protein [Synechococcus sp. KORDI-100]|uniref:hypothetical protein n=1 Tax=Synechococcus sp. KORDI-100 TaxID=1280380 RepID=UPI0012E0871C|nr:hypothetical protein [Synechococcus sp. KORDI-100]